MYTRNFKNGFVFERYIFGEPGVKREAHTVENKAVTLSTALRRVIANTNGQLYPQTDVGHSLWHFVSRFLSPHLSIKKLGFYSSIKTDADFRHGVDGFFYLVSQDRECLAVIDAFLMPWFLVRRLRVKQIESCTQRQDEIYRIKRIIKEVRRLCPGDEICWPKFWEIYDSGAKENFLRFRNSFVITPDDLSRSKGVKELGKEIAKSLFTQVQPTVRLPF